MTLGSAITVPATGAAAASMVAIKDPRERRGTLGSSRARPRAGAGAGCVGGDPDADKVVCGKSFPAGSAGPPSGRQIKDAVRGGVISTLAAWVM